MQTSQWCQVQGAEVIGGTFEVIDFCVETVDIEQLRCIRSSFSVEIYETAELSGFGGWFDVQFSGSEASPAPSPVTLSTAPGSPTHWAQQVFLVSPPQPVERGDVLAGCVTVRRQKQNHRLLWVQIRFTHSRAMGPEPKLTRTPRGLRRVRTGYAYQPPALGTRGAGRLAPRAPRTVRTGYAYQPRPYRTSCVPWLSPQARARDGRDPARAHAQLPHRVAPRRPGCAALTKSAHLPSAFKVNT